MYANFSISARARCKCDYAEKYCLIWRNVIFECTVLILAEKWYATRTRSKIIEFKLNFHEMCAFPWSWNAENECRIPRVGRCGANQIFEVGMHFTQDEQIVRQFNDYRLTFYLLPFKLSVCSFFLITQMNHTSYKSTDYADAFINYNFGVAVLACETISILGPNTLH